MGSIWISYLELFQSGALLTLGYQKLRLSYIDFNWLSFVTFSVRNLLLSSFSLYFQALSRPHQFLKIFLRGGWEKMFKKLCLFMLLVVSDRDFDTLYLTHISFHFCLLMCITDVCYLTFALMQYIFLMLCHDVMSRCHVKICQDVKIKMSSNHIKTWCQPTMSCHDIISCQAIMSYFHVMSWHHPMLLCIKMSCHNVLSWYHVMMYCLDIMSWSIVLISCHDVMS